MNANGSGAGRCSKVSAAATNSPAWSPQGDILLGSLLHGGYL